MSCRTSACRSGGDAGAAAMPLAWGLDQFKRQAAAGRRASTHYEGMAPSGSWLSSCCGSMCMARTGCSRTVHRCVRDGMC